MKSIYPFLILTLFFNCNKSEKSVFETNIISSKNKEHVEAKFVNEKFNILKDRLIPMSGYQRVETKLNSWESFLQNLNLQESGKPILKYDGTEISDQKHHVGILTYDVGSKDLQQCADALIRLRAEYLFKNEKYNAIHFKFTSGHQFYWNEYADGLRPIVSGNNVDFSKRAAPNSINSYQDFRQYLDIIYTYAGTISLARDLKESKNKIEFNIGDLIITPGSPGHVVMIVDKIEKGNEKRYALIEGYTPAQSIHILSKNGNPWFDIKPSKEIITPRYHFEKPVIKQF
ncbi:DUF4846 domain-containing protein [Soonwooa purpurea]